MENKLTYENQIEFKEWLNLNLNSVSWEGRYLDEFNQVWEMIFEPNIEISTQFQRLKNINKVASQGPILAWFKWLNQKLVCYLYLHYDLSIKELVNSSGLNFSSVSLILRDFFVDRFPHLEEQINLKFQIGSPLSENLHLRYNDLGENLIVTSDDYLSNEDEVMMGLEVTLYSDWKKLKSFYIDNNVNNQNINQILKDKSFLRRQVHFFRELTILFFIGGLLILLIKVGNKAYEDYLVEKISLFSPNFFWLDKNLSFQSENFIADNELKIRLDEIESLEKLESKKVFNDVSVAKRFEVESDVVLTSVETIPKDIAEASLEQSNYEEVKKGGYRNSRYGRRKAYRVMMTSVDPNVVKTELKEILKKYNVKQVDNVKPGTAIPGGIYFNLYVPRKHLKEFLSKVSSYEDQSTILESKTAFSGPANMDKVFIWIKSI